MYFPIGWPKVLKIPSLEQSSIKQLTCNRDRILFALLSEDSISVWFCKPCVPIVFYRRTPQSLSKMGTNVLMEWKPDSSMIVVATSEGHLILYNLGVISDSKGLYIQTDSPYANLRRDSAELFIKEIIPPLSLTESQEIMVWDGQITGIVCITMTEFMVSTNQAHVLRYRWDGSDHRDYNLDLRRTPFCINQQVSKAIPIVEENTYIINIEYSPLVGGFSIVLNDGRAAFLTATTLKFDPNQVQGIWAQGIEDATCTAMNHKYRLITFGRANSQCIVYYVDESTGGLEISHNCILSSKDYPGDPGPVEQILWTPDGCAFVAAWQRGGIAMWSTFGSLLMCSLAWDYGLNIDLQKRNPLQIQSMQFATEGFQLWMVHRETAETDESSGSAIYDTKIMQLDFMKSALTNNPCMSHQNHLYLQGEDKLYVNSADSLLKIFSERAVKDDSTFGETVSMTSTLAEGRQWLVIPVPSTYSATNWPIRYSAIDSEGQNIAVAGRTGLAHYSIQTRRWKLFGNETQEKDFIVLGGLLWWREYIVMGCYSIVDNSDQIRFYHKESKLDNKFAKIVTVSSPVLLMNILQDQLIIFGSDGQVSIWMLKQGVTVASIEAYKVQAIDISALAIHPACIVSVTLTMLRTETGRGQHNNSESIVLNVSGKLLLVQREVQNGERYTCSMPTVLASCVENVWVPSRRRIEKAHLTEALWLFCGAHGMRVWLPLYPKDGDKSHTFMSKRIMLPFHLKIYPLAILFEDAIILGAENDTVLYSLDSKSPFSLPFSVLQRTSQVYLHQILRQLIRRNLGFHAWEIARSCMSLPYFPHSLELLLHEVLEEEATSKEPIPDAQLPSVIEFIMEFPVYLQTVVQCARKTEIALWPYLFSAAGKPKDLFQECMAKRQLDTAASYLIILQNLEASSVSRQYATLLLNTALDQSKWELAKDLVRFLRAIDPNDVESPRTSFILPPKLSLPQQTPPVSPNVDDLSLILGNVQGPRGRSYSTTISPKLAENRATTSVNPTFNSNVNSVDSPQTNRKKSMPISMGSTKYEKNVPNNTAEEFFIDVILQKHARRLLSTRRLTDLGFFAAHLDFHLVTWLAKERDRAARIDDCVQALKQLHDEFAWPYPSSSNSTVQIAKPENAISGTDDRLKLLKIDVANHPSTSSRVGDSGYMSFQGLPCTGLITPMNTLDSSQVAETELGEISQSDSENSLSKINDKVELAIDSLYYDKAIDLYTNSKSEMYNLGDRILETRSCDRLDEGLTSTFSSVWGDEQEGVASASDVWEVPSSQILEQLSNSDTKGSHRSEVQLRYLLQLFMEASCLEWSLIISVLLRDAMAVLRTVNAAKSQDQSIEAVSRLRQGLLLLQYWTNAECLGYRAFMLAIQNQISVLTKILETKIQHQKIIEYQKAVSASLNKISSPIPSRSRKTSSNHDTSSQCGSLKDKKTIHVIGKMNSADKLSEVQNTPPDSSQKPGDDLQVSKVIPESTGCVIS